MNAVEHATWCNVEWDNGPCDCGGNGGRCPICGAQGPCGFLRDGDTVSPAFCSMSSVRPVAPQAAKEGKPRADS